jgi:ribose transport system ATP-binding protein
VDGLAAGTASDVSFDVRAGEIVGIAGIVGSGREDVAYLVGGARAPVRGVVELPGRLRSPYGPRDALKAGVVFVASDRETESAVLTLTSRENLTMPRLDARGPLRWIDLGRERAASYAWLDRLGVQPPEPERTLATLSGGNQQKVVLARALRCAPRVLVLDEPVQGVDVGAKASIFTQLKDAARSSIAVLVTSSDPEDLVAVCDRVLVMRRGTIRAQLSREEISVPRILGECLLSDGAERQEVAAR